MGSSASKPETKVFTPSTPIDFSASFLSQLENSSESDYSRAQYTEKYIQDRVAAELRKLEQETVKSFQSVTNDSLIQDKKPGLSVNTSNEKLEKLTKLLEENVKLAKVEVSKDVQEARGEVIKCLKDNKGKSLNCWEEVEAFTKLIKEL